MSHRKYRADNVKDLNVERLCASVAGRRVVLGIDVAKTGMFLAVMDKEEEVHATLKWSHPKETPKLLEVIGKLREQATRVDVAMEPSGVYGDALRHGLQAAGFTVHRVSPKRSHDMAEVYDGVASLHDAKSAAIVAKLHLDGASELWPIKSDQEREMQAELKVLDIHSKQCDANRYRLEALLSRHWPELTEYLALDGATLLELLSVYGGPREVAAEAAEARELMRRKGGVFLSTEKIEAAIESASTTLGLPPIEAEVRLIRHLAAETKRNREEEAQARRRIEALVGKTETTERLQPLVGKVTAAVLVAATGDPQSYSSAQAYQKSLGLNLREHSSGKVKGGLHITKRGSGTGRFYLGLASLRLIQTEPVVKAWYAKMVARQGGDRKTKAVVAVMRKLALAIWHVARGAKFDALKLFDVRRLEGACIEGR
jgi:transposase